MNKKAALITIKNSFLNKGIDKIINGIKLHSSQIQVFDINNLNIVASNKIVKNFEILIFDDYIMNIEHLEPKRKNYLVKEWKTHEFYQKNIEILMGARKKILWMSHHDLHGDYIVNQEKEKLSKNLFDHIIWFYEHQEKGKANISAQYIDDWMKKYDDPIDKKIEIIEKFDSRIDLPFCMSYPSKKYKKDRDVIVPGIRYRTRRIAENSLKKYKHHFRKSNYASIDKLLKGAEFLVKKLPQKVGHKAYQLVGDLRSWNYKKELGRTKICWIDGSGYAYPVHKFFEAIEARTLIITCGLTGLREYGFVPNVHYIECKPEEFGKMAYDTVKKNDFLIEVITTNAYEFAATIHSVQARIEQLDQCIQAMSENNFELGVFLNGYFKVTCK